MSRVCIVFNPAARGDKAQRLEEKIREVAVGAEIKRSNAPGDATKLAEQALVEGYDVVVAAGGDGTLNEVINGLSRFDSETAGAALGVLPIGTINVFALELGIPNDLEKAWGTITAGKMREIDLGCANGQRFVQLAGVGFDARVVEKNDIEMKRLIGPLSYIFTSAQVMVEKAPQIHVETEEGEAFDGAFLLVGNGRFYGGSFPLFPEAQLDDGMLDFCLFEQMNPLAVARYVQGILSHSHTRLPDVRYFKSRRARVTSPTAVPVQVDGELLEPVPCEFRVLERGLKVLVP